MSRLSHDTHLLPSNALESERSLARAVAYGDNILPEDIRTIWRPEAVAARYLPFLAWGLHLDFWRDEWPDEIKRTLIAGSFAWHRKKGTIWAVKKVLDDLGFVPTIKEWWMPEMGTKPHTFSVSGHYKDDPLYIDFLGPDTEAQLIQAVEVAKPLRSHLIFLVVAPPAPDMTDHICRWDWCTWDHGLSHEYVWPVVPPVEGLLAMDASVGIEVERGVAGRYVTGPVWDGELWDIGICRDMAYITSRTVTVSLVARWEDYDAPIRWDCRTWQSPIKWTSTYAAATADIYYKEEP